MSLWFVGVIFEIISTGCGTVGKQLIRFSENIKLTNPVSSKQFFRLGLFINTIVGPVLDVAAYSFANQSLIAPFGGLDVVWNALLAPYFLKEQLTRGRVQGCVLILIGTALAGIFGNHSEPEYSVEYFENTFVNWRVLIYFIAFIAWFLFNRFFLMRFPKGSLLRGVSLGWTAGTIAGNMFCVKVAMELIKISISKGDGDVWRHWITYVSIIGAIFFALTNVIYMTQGLREYEALFMVTMYEGSMIVSGCVSGSIVLLDLRGLLPWRVAVYTLSVCLVVVGLFVIFLEERRRTSSLLSGTASIEVPEGHNGKNLLCGPSLHCCADLRRDEMCSAKSMSVLSDMTNNSDSGTPVRRSRSADPVIVTPRNKVAVGNERQPKVSVSPEEMEDLSLFLAKYGADRNPIVPDPELHAIEFDSEGSNDEQHAARHPKELTTTAVFNPCCSCLRA